MKITLPKVERSLLGGLALMAALVLTGCGFEEGAGETEVRLALGFGPDRGWAIDTDDAYPITNLGIGEPLGRIGFDGEIGPGLAESWERVDGTTWEFELREGVTFHNGEELDAAAVVGALTSLAQDSTSPPPGLTAEEVTYEEAGPLTVRVITEEEDPIMPQRLAGRNTAIFAPEAYENEDWPPRPFGMGTGPFMVEEEPSGDSVTLTGFEEYWDGEPQAESAEVRFIEDPNTRSDTLRSGEVDLADLLPTTQLPVLEGEEDLEVFSEDVPRTTTLHTNMDSGPTSDPLVREAISLAVDREALARDVMEGVGDPAAGIFSPADPWFEESREVVDPDPERARELLSEAGYEEGELDLALQTYPDRDHLPNLATAVQGMLSEVGIRTDIQVSEYATVEPDVLEGDYDLAIFSRGYIIETNDAAGLLETDFTCGGSYNLNRYCSEDLDAIVDALNVTADEEERFELFREAETTILEDFAGVPLVHEQESFAHTEDLEGFQPHPTKHYLLTTEIRSSE